MRTAGRDVSGASHQDGRVAWVDTAKGICIILVVMMHSTLGLGEAVGLEGWLHDVVAFAKPFRMPDFFLVSGLFLSRVIDRDWRTYGDKRVVHFLYFYALWFVIQFALKGWGMAQGDPREVLRLFALGFIEPLGTLWFIYLLAVLSVVTKLLRGVPPLVLFGLAAVLQTLPIHTGWTVIDEFAARWVYFVAGYLFAPQIFALAQRAGARPAVALAGLAVWAVVNGWLAFAPSSLAGFPTLASLPVVSLILGLAGAAAIVTTAALLTRTALARPFAYCGRNSIAIYLAFFLPMAAMRALLVKLGLVADVGWAAAAITAVAVIAPLVLERLVRGTALDVLFVRPAAFHLAPVTGRRLGSAAERATG